MPVTMPASPPPNGAQPRLLDFGGVQRPFLGGPIQKLNRLGLRFAVTFSMPPLSQAAGLVIVSRLIQARATELLIDYPLGNAGFAPVGTPLVKVAASGGTTLQIKGLTPGSTIGEGRFFHVMHSGRPWLHMLAAPVTADGAGDAVAGIWPPFRTPISVNDAISFAAPRLQGHVVDEQLSWDIAIAQQTMLSFTVEESQ